MTGAEIISKFETYVDDTTELSSTDELDLLNKIYLKVCDDRPWEFLKTEKTGTVSGTTVTLPTDFSYLLENYDYTDNSASMGATSKPAYVFVNGSPLKVVNWSDRRRYANNSGVCYIDIVNSNMVFPVSKSGPYSFDYAKVPTAITLTASPVFPARYHAMLYHGMAVDDMIIQLFDRAKSYAVENEIKYRDYLADMSLWNANLSMN